jgi:cation diffusion facilitator family transporter
LARPPLARLLWLSVAAALATIALKTLAWALTGSVGLLSDAAESVVNLVAALFALVIVHWAGRPPDEDHPYGHEKADYLSAGVEGSLILLAALTIAYSAIGRFLDPQPISHVGIGLSVSVVASAINLVVARRLIAAGREHRSVVLEADGRHPSSAARSTQCWRGTPARAWSSTRCAREARGRARSSQCTSWCPATGL